MKISEFENLEYRKIPAIHYKSDNNTVTITNKLMAHLFDIFYIGIPKEDRYNQIHYRIYMIYPELENLALDYTVVTPWTSTENIQEIAYKLHRDTLENWMRHINSGIMSSVFFRNSEILYISKIDKELSEKMMESRKRNQALKEQREAEQREELRRQHIEYVQQKNEEANQVIHAAIQTIQRGGTVKNSKISIYKLTDDSYSWNEISLILYLMKCYDVSVPLKTQGWINRTLASCSFQDGKCTCYSRWKNGGNSKVICDYLDELARAAT